MQSCNVLAMRIPTETDVKGITRTVGAYPVFLKTLLCLSMGAINLALETVEYASSARLDESVLPSSDLLAAPAANDCGHAHGCGYAHGSASLSRPGCIPLQYLPSGSTT